MKVMDKLGDHENSKFLNGYIKKYIDELRKEIGIQK